MRSTPFRILSLFLAASAITVYGVADAAVAAGRAAGADRIAGAVAGRRAEDLLHAARLSRRARRQRAAGPGSDRHGLGRRRPPLGRRDAGLRADARHRRAERRSDRPRRRPRGHERRRHDGQADGLRRRARPAARAEGARPRRARRRAAEPVADAGHQRRPEDGHEGAGDQPLRPPRSAASSTTPTACSGRSTTGSTRRTATSTCA